MKANVQNPLPDGLSGRVGEVLRDGSPEALHHYLFLLGGHDPGLVSHVFAVAAFSREIAQQAGVSRLHTDIIWLAGLLHDVGKVTVPRRILRKRGPLTMAERKAVEGHSVAGWEILSRLDWAEEVAPLVRSHHEWWNGSGYPQGLRGEEIEPGARILAVADALDAMTTDRSYREAVPYAEALRELSAMAGRQFDPEVVKTALATPPEKWAELRRAAAASGSDGRYPIAG